MLRIKAGLLFAWMMLMTGEARAYEAVTVTNGGAVSGRISFTGALVQPQPVLISKDNHVCGDGHVEQNPVRVSAGRLADVVVFLEGIERGKPWPSTPAEIVQEKCAFHPFVQVAQRGAELKVINKDPLLHNIHTYEIIGRARRTLFNIAQPRAGQIDAHSLEMRRGQVVEVACDAHNWMSAWIYTLDHPYWAVIGHDGNFEIGDVPPGNYRLVAWHPALGTQSRDVVVRANGRLSLEIAFNAPKT
jgi:hypothetical protein